ncbi:DNA polymerase III subunit beta [Methylotenera sp.]|jgi:DNA polymerase-3 subunit beta|uniref:Beta sliding clamp n=1 Tax=Methylotenera mobilis TaxID=359408 RepID=A0A351R874_9PROT|nr:DNA polymerase III subunit beta [Methylotenera sp.]MDP3211223.1 DNA polymerase III subunit beta [Methylotenera sp.]MDP3777947.1 DNA polymerase III subunit beta [Methylotenera sp.]HBA08245.1 DNA polymerase III subunit beta [Methylotenera mobilis]
MNIQINRETLLKPLTSVTSIVEKRHTLPILSNLLLEAKQNKIHLTATDLEMQISLSVESATSNDFSTTISAKKLLDICRSLPDNSDINMATNDSRITVKAGKSRFNLQTLPAADYPVMTKTQSQGTVVTIPQRQLKELLKQVEFAMAQQDIRYYLNGLLVEVVANRLNIVGTDGHRLSFTSTELKENYEKQDVILPRKTVIELIKLLDDSEEDVNVEIANNQVNFSFGNIKLISKVIDGKFPDYNRVIPTGHQNTFTTERLGVLLAMQRASILSNEKYRGIRMVLSNNNLKLISTNSDQEEAEEELEIAYGSDVLDIGFNVTYLIDVLNNTNSEQVTFSFADANSSCLITLPNNPDYKYVVMPMRI